MPKITLNQNQVKFSSGLQNAQTPYFGSSDLNNASGAVLPGGYIAPCYALGSTWELDGTSSGGFGGASFQYVILDIRSAAAAAGNNMMWSLPVSGTVTASGSSTSAIKTNIDTTSFTNATGVNGCLLSIFDTAKSIIVIRKILSTTNGALTAKVGTNTIFTIASATDSLVGNDVPGVNALSAIPTNGVPCQLILPNWVTLYDHGNLIYPSAGFALGTVTPGNYTIIQKSGVGQALMVGGGTAVVSGAPTAPSGVTDGILIGSATLQASTPGLALMASSTTVQLMPILITETCP